MRRSRLPAAIAAIMPSVRRITTYVGSTGGRTTSRPTPAATARTADGRGPMSGPAEQPARPGGEDDAHGAEQREVGDLREQRLAEVVGEAEDDRGQQGAAEAPHAADDHDDERVRQDLEVEPGVDAHERRADHTADAGQERPEAEDRHAEHGDVDAERLGHLRVVDGRADHRAAPRPLLEPPQHDEEDGGRPDHEEAEDGEAEAAEPDAALEVRRPPEVERVAAPDQQAEILHEQGDAHRQEHLPEIVALDRPEEHALDEHAREGHGERGGAERQVEVPGSREHGHADVAAEQAERAVSDVDDLHHAEDQREAAADEEQQGGVGDAVERLVDPELHLATPPPRLTVLAGWVVAAVDRLLQVLLRVVLPELRDRGVDLDHGVLVHAPDLVHAPEVDVLDDVPVLVDLDGAPRRALDLGGAERP